MSTANTLPQIQTFAESCQLESVTNFLSFSNSIVSIARGYSLEGYIDGTIPHPSANIAPSVLAAGATPGQPVIPTPTSNNSPTPLIDEWDLRNARLAAMIYMNVKDPHGIRLNLNQTAKDIAAQNIAKEHLKSLRFNEGDRFDVYFSNLKSEANEVGCTITDEDLVSQFLTNLPPSDSYAWIIQNYSGKSYSEIYASLIEIQLHKDSIKDSNGGNRAVVPTALANTTNTRSNNSTNCPNNGLYCTNCSHHNHTRARCYAPGGGWQDRVPAWWKPPGETSTAAIAQTATAPVNPTAMATVVAMGSDVGGMASFHALATKANVLSTRHSGETPPILKDNISKSIEGNAIPYTLNSVLFTSLNESISSCSPTFLNSAASECCIHDKHLFLSFTPKQAQGRMATNGDSGKFLIEGFGVIQFKVKNSGGTVRTLRMSALYTPSFSMNLLSIPSFDAKGFIGAWGSGRLSVIDPRTKEVIIDGKLAVDKGSHCLYQAHIIKPTSEANALATGVSVSAGGGSLRKPCSLAM
ncbi:hypothetical protein FB446DRAFT_795111 [Lentinula raphanica]|nr:hypothetical protein FB446DRAFT_795111 [Lentinula raphanica]